MKNLDTVGTLSLRREALVCLPASESAATLRCSSTSSSMCLQVASVVTDIESNTNEWLRRDLMKAMSPSVR